MTHCTLQAIQQGGQWTHFELFYTRREGPLLSQNGGNVVLSFWFANFWVSRTFGQGAQTKVLSRKHLNAQTDWQSI